MRNFLLLTLAILGQLFFLSINAYAESYPVMCRGGGNMTAQMGSAGGASIVVDFEHAPQGYLAAKPGKGQCAWSDRAMNENEPTRFLLRDAATMGATLMNQIQGGYFSVNAFTDGGLLAITSVNILDNNEATDEEKPMNDEQHASNSGSDFGGRWDSATDNGDELSLDLEQKGKVVNGTYRSSEGGRGTIKGAIKGGALHFSWRFGKNKGSGVFELSDDGDSFEGSYTASGSGEEGVWSGSRE